MMWWILLFNSALAADRDGDGIDDAVDNCLGIANPGQEDVNSDTFGDACVDTTAVVHSTVILGSGSTIDAGAVVEAGVILGAGVGVGSSATVRNGAQIASKATIGPGASVGMSAAVGRRAQVLGTVGASSIIGRAARIEAGATFGGGVMGYAAVVKAGAVLGTGARLSNLSLVGASVMAGTGLHVGRQATVGSNASLGDDVTIGPNATVGNNAMFANLVTLRRGAIVAASVDIGLLSVIGRGVILGASVNVDPMVVIRASSDIGAGNTVTTDLPRGTIWPPLISLPATFDLAGSDLIVDGTGNTELIAREVVSIPDRDGDGADEFAIGTFNGNDTGTFHVFFSGSLPASPTTLPGAASVVITDNTTNAGFGHVAVRIPDITGDGIDDLALGSPYNDLSGGNAGAVWIVSPPDIPLSGTIDISALATWVIRPDGNDSSNFGTSIAAGNFDGDALADLVVGSRFDPNGGLFNQGSAAVILGADLGAAGQTQLLGTVAHEIIHGHVASLQAGNGVAAVDLNGDGVDEMIVGAKDADTGAANSGSAWIFDGTTLGSATPRVTTDALAEIHGPGAGYKLGSVLNRVPDWDGDGIDELFVGGTGGVVYLFRGPDVMVGGTFSASAAAALSFASTGPELEAVGDLDGDGVDDLMLLGAGSPAARAFIYGSKDFSLNGAQLFTPDTQATSVLTFENIGGGGSEAINIRGTTADFDGDGFGDLVLGNPYASRSVSLSGSVYAVSISTLSGP